MAPRLLIVDDDADGREALADLARGWGWEARGAADGDAALPLALSWRPDAILTDLYMPARDGMWLLRALASEIPDVPVVLLTGQGSIAVAVEAIREGAYDFIEKPPAAGRLRLVLDRALQRGRVQREVELLRGRLASAEPAPALLGEAPATRALTDLVRAVAPAASSVILQGPSGAGKEAVARTLHALSPRAGGPFVAVNCAALPAQLIEAELFGHERGAFTGARERRPGLLEIAAGGTLLLDEVGEMALEVQAKLLRVLEDRRTRRLGGRAEVEIDVRVLAATARDLRWEVDQGRFREDLFFRLAVFTIDVPPLSARLDDVPLLARHFARRLAAEAGRPPPEIDPAALQFLREHAWPGNVRELRNVVERALILAGSGPIRPTHLPPEIHRRDGAEEIRLRLGRTLEEAEREYLLATLRRFGGNRSRTAAVLGVSQKTLYNKLRRYALDDGA